MSSTTEHALGHQLLMLMLRRSASQPAAIQPGTRMLTDCPAQLTPVYVLNAALLNHPHGLTLFRHSGIVRSLTLSGNGAVKAKDLQWHLMIPLQAGRVLCNPGTLVSFLPFSLEHRAPRFWCGSWRRLPFSCPYYLHS